MIRGIADLETPGARDVAAKARAAADRPASEVRRDAERGTGWYAWVARGGLVAKGVSYAIVGALAVQVALGEGGRATSRQGALATIAGGTLGKTLLVALALGFAAYAIWRFVSAVVERESEDDASGKAKKWGKRAGYVGRGLIYAGLTFTTLEIVAGSGAGQSQNEEARSTTARVLEWPAGRWLVGVGGVAIIGAGAWTAYRGATSKFADEWRTIEMSGAERRWGGRAAIAGHFARAVVFALIGVFVTKAALEYDPQEAIGLDGALQKLAETTYGTPLLGATAAGLVCYGLYCFVDARYRDVSAETG